MSKIGDWASAGARLFASVFALGTMCFAENAHCQYRTIVTGESGRWSVSVMNPWVGGSPTSWNDIASKAKARSLQSSELFESVARVSKRHDAVFVDMTPTTRPTMVFVEYSPRGLGMTLADMEKIFISGPHPENLFATVAPSKLRSCISTSIGREPVGGLPSLFVRYDCQDYGAQLWITAIQLITPPDGMIQLRFIGRGNSAVDSINSFNSVLSSFRFTK